MSPVTAPEITWHRTHAWSAEVFDKTVLLEADEDRVAVSIDNDKLFEIGIVGADKVRALVFEQGELAATFALDFARAEGSLKQLSVFLGGMRKSTGERWAYKLALGELAMRAWDAHRRMRAEQERADTPVTPVQLSATSELGRLVH